jgi:hypothetical protein
MRSSTFSNGKIILPTVKYLNSFVYKIRFKIRVCVCVCVCVFVCVCVCARLRARSYGCGKHTCIKESSYLNFTKVCVLGLGKVFKDMRQIFYPASYTMGTGGSFRGSKTRPGRDADHSPPSSAEDKKE